MSLQMRESTTEYMFAGWTGTIPSVGAEVAFMADPEAEASDADYQPAVLVTSVAHPLWADAKRTGLTGDYYVAILVGSYGGGGVPLAKGPYQRWDRCTDVTERPVRVCTVAVEIL